MIKITNINKFYNKGKSTEIHVLNNISLELPDTSLVTILGKSGSGKSTLLNVIGLLDKANGTINYNDELEINKYSSSKIDQYRNNNIGYIFQNYSLLPDLTVYENLIYALDLIGITEEDEVNNRIDKALDLVNMKHYKKRNVLALSGGQQQRIAIARAIVKGSKVLIADEPTGNLDTSNTSDVMDILKSISKTCLVILVTHDNSIATTYSDRIINLKDGCVVSDELNNSNVEVKEFDEKTFIKTTNYKYNYSKLFFSNVLNSFKNVFNTFKKQKMIHIAFILIGIILSYNISMLNSNLSVNRDDVLQSDDYETIYITDSNFNYKNFYNNELFSDIFIAPKTTQYQPTIELPIEYSQTVYLSSNCYMLSTNHYSNLKYTKELNDNEVILSKYAAENFYDKISMYKKFTKEELVGYSCVLNGISYKIVAIEENLENNAILTNLNIYSNIYKTSNQNINMYTYEDAIDLGVTLPQFSNYDDSKTNVYINGNSLLAYNCNIIETNFLEPNSIIFATKEDYIKHFSYDKVLTDYTLLEGNEPLNDNEVIIPLYLKNTQFETNCEYNVTGYYNLEAGYFPYLITSVKEAINEANHNSDIKEFYANDIDFILDNLENSAYYKDYILVSKFNSNKESNQAAIITILVLIAAIVIILFFISRAKMLNQIKNLGIYRALGSSKLKIYLLYIAQSLSLITVTTIIGYFIFHLGLYYLNSYIPFFDSYILPIYYLILVVVSIYIIMIIASLLPVILLLRKTPIEINAKYDI